MGWEGSFSPDGQRIAYVPMSRAFTAWKRYRGGQTTPIGIASLSNSRVERVPRENSNDFCPMWVDDKVFFLSDRNGVVTLFSYDLKTKKVVPAAAHDGIGFKSASAGPGAIVVEQFGQLLLYDIGSGTLAPVSVNVAGDLSELRPRFVNVARRLASAHISPTGARALFEARGEILTVPAEKGDTRNLTQTTGVMERDPAWSPDGRWIAYFSDESGEYELHVRDSMGKEAARKVRLEDKPSFYSTPTWSPDSKKIAYLDAHLGVWDVDIDQKKPTKVDKDRYLGGASQRAPVWSPDGKWLAYSKRLKNYLGAIFLYSLADAKSTQLTDGMSDARFPSFDKGGNISTSRPAPIQARRSSRTSGASAGPSRAASISPSSRRPSHRRSPRKATRRKLRKRASRRRTATPAGLTSRSQPSRRPRMTRPARASSPRRSRSSRSSSR